MKISRKQLIELVNEEMQGMRRWLGALRDAVNDIASVMLTGFLAAGHDWAAAPAPGDRTRNKR